MYDSKLPARPPIGSSLTRPKFPFTHKGVYVGHLFGGYDQVFTNSPDNHEHLTSFEDFAQGQKVSVTPRVLPSTQELYQRVHTALNSGRKYDAIKNNCDHAESRVLTGIAESGQVLGWAAAAALLGIFAVGSSKA